MVMTMTGMVMMMMIWRDWNAGVDETLGKQGE